MSANATTPRQAGQTPQTAEEAGRIIEALRARIEEKEGESERLKADRNALSEAIAAKEVDDAVGLQPYADGEKKKHFTAMNTLDAQIGQSETTLERLRERLAQAERELAEIEMRGCMEGIAPLCERIHGEAVSLRELLDAAREKIAALSELYQKVERLKQDYVWRYQALNVKATGSGEDRIETQVSDYEAGQTLPPSCRPMPPDFLFNSWKGECLRWLGPKEIEFLDLVHENVQEFMDKQPQDLGGSTLVN